MDNIPLIRIFLSSPGDVNDERQIALEVIERLPNRPAFRERVTFRVIAWDKAGAGTSMRATLTPQEAINKGLPKPSECDIVVVLFWSRMGTPFAMDGQAFQSGTHWELLDALNSPRPETLIFRRIEKKLFEADDNENREQYLKVEAFFKSDLFYDPATRAIRRGVNQYATPEDFRGQFETYLEELVVELLRRSGRDILDDPTPTSDPDGHITDIGSQRWEGSPFPGLRPFAEQDAPIFFGRGRETDALVKQVAASRFVAVMGASGSGKSSLVGAGLIPRLRANAIAGENLGSKDWHVVRFMPGQGRNPFEALAEALMETIPVLGCEDPLDYPERLEKLTDSLQAKPDRLARTLHQALKNDPAWAEVLLFIDQFEELFTLADARYAEPFAAMLADVAASSRVRAVVTMRVDFFPRAVAYPQLAELLRNGSFPLAAPTTGSLYTMITGPAEQAGLEFAAGLVEQILDDTGDEPGNLALMAYALDELYKLAESRRETTDNTSLVITPADYRSLKGVKGAVGTRAEAVFATLPGEVEAKEQVLQAVFRRLVTVDDRGTATRQRAEYNAVAATPEAQALVKAFTQARLLVSGTDGDDTLQPEAEPVVEVAHEALFSNWPRLTEWIEATQDARRLIRRIEREAMEWDRQGKPDFLRPTAEELAQLEAACQQLGVTIDTPVVKAFCEPEQVRLLLEIGDANTSHQRRSAIGERLSVIGDPRKGIGLREDGLPDIAWCPVLAGRITLEGNAGTFDVARFYIAKYPITYVQFQVFLDDPDGFANPEWWRELEQAYRQQEMGEQSYKFDNHPRETVSWYQAVAFCHWLNARLPQSAWPEGAKADWTIRLPTEWEWQQAATGGLKDREYPGKVSGIAPAATPAKAAWGGRRRWGCISRGRRRWERWTWRAMSGSGA
jgi:hypothetical protein